MLHTQRGEGDVLRRAECGEEAEEVQWPVAGAEPGGEQGRQRTVGRFAVATGGRRHAGEAFGEETDACLERGMLDRLLPQAREEGGSDLGQVFDGGEGTFRLAEGIQKIDRACGRRGIRRRERREQEGGAIVEVHHRPVGVEHDGGEGIVRGDQPPQGRKGRSEARIALAGLSEGRREAGRNQRTVAQAERCFELGEPGQQQPAARPRPPALNKADVALGNAEAQRQLQLADAPGGPRLAQQVPQVGRKLVHRAMVPATVEAGNRWRRVGPGLTWQVIAGRGPVLDSAAVHQQETEPMPLSKSLIVAVLAAFGALSAVALWQHGYLGIILPHFQSFGAGQVFADLVIALLLILVWMVRDARRTGRNPWPYVALTLAAGSFGPLVYLLLAPADAAA